jgi:hypothetical protein
MNNWLNKYEILNKEDIHDLEREAAMIEFKNGFNRSESENLAYQSYFKKQLCKGAAFHLDGMATAKSRADKDSEQRHYANYILICQKLGLKPNDGISHEINAFRGQFSPDKYMQHPADKWALK